MTRFALAWFLVVAALGGARADVVSDLLRGEAVIADRDSPEERGRGIRLALTRVLVKVCGDDRIAGHPQLPNILAEADSHVLGFEFEDNKNDIRMSDGEGTGDRSYHVRVDFDRDRVHDALHRLGYLPWHEDRPRLLVVLSVSDRGGRFFVGTESIRGTGQRETLVLDARRRGLVLLLPKMDIVESLALSHREVAEIHGGALGALATSYGAEAVLAGTMAITADGHWDTTWTLLADGMPVSWAVPRATFDKAIGLGLGQSARALAGLQ